MSACDRGRLKMSTQKSACLDTQIFVHEQFIIAIDWYTGLNQFLTEGNPKNFDSFQRPFLWTIHLANGLKWNLTGQSAPRPTGHLKTIF